MELYCLFVRCVAIGSEISTDESQADLSALTKPNATLSVLI